MAQIEGKNPVIEGLKGNRKINKIYLRKDIKGKKITHIKKEAEKQGIPLEEVSKKEMKNLASSQVPQGVVALAEEIDLKEPEDILKNARIKEETPFIVILDHLKDPYNFGAIIRTAYAAGAHGIIFPKDRAASITPVVVKASAGAIEHIMMSKVTNINYTIDKLKNERVWIAGADLAEDARPFYNMDFERSTAVVIGSEGDGLKRLVKENCDFLIKIPMQGAVSSLNASVAAGIVLFEVRRQRITQ
ncbi:MAG: 23S rRNA (guanosine(2251)-2'-O)-methyltransferase RlmB [Bacillota bacterium]